MTRQINDALCMFNCHNCFNDCPIKMPTA